MSQGFNGVNVCIQHPKKGDIAQNNNQNRVYAYKYTTQITLKNHNNTTISLTKTHIKTTK
ncbi:hypothetical protein VSVS05_03115 [Vibrio scophthalmi]|uniref:Uncharacterized protein n=1 Tax=Vibrio scophthalmi TaxID=45658 RepID=A0A1C7FFG8_9VIBR|nr:hypothetical protein VSVS05_03115 [Vibrio scophthalmi]